MVGGYERRFKEAHWTLRHALETHGLTDKWYDGKAITSMHSNGDLTTEDLLHESLAHLDPRHHTEALRATITKDIVALVRLGGRIGYLTPNDIASTEPLANMATVDQEAVSDADLCTKGLNRKVIT